MVSGKGGAEPTGFEAADGAPDEFSPLLDEIMAAGATLTT